MELHKKQTKNTHQYRQEKNKNKLHINISKPPDNPITRHRTLVHK